MGLLDYNNIFVKEKVRFLKYGNVYDLLDEQGKLIGSAKEENITFLRKIIKLTKYKYHLGFDVSFYDERNNRLFTIHSGPKFFLSKATVKDRSGRVIGKYIQKFKLLKPRFLVEDQRGTQIATFEGKWHGWNYWFTNNNDERLCDINKKFAGLKEIFTTADHYHIQFDKSIKIDGDTKKLVLAGAAIIDILFTERR